jgi:hypothetical protein
MVGIPCPCGEIPDDTELEIGIPYPTPVDRKELENLIKANWQAKAQVPLAQASVSGGEYLNNVKNWIFDR